MLSGFSLKAVKSLLYNDITRTKNEKLRKSFGFLSRGVFYTQGDLLL